MIILFISLMHFMALLKCLGLQLSEKPSRNLNLGKFCFVSPPINQLRQKKVAIQSDSKSNSYAALTWWFSNRNRSVISIECKKLIKNNQNLAKKYLTCTEEQKWILNCLSTGKGSIPYEIITRYDSLDITPENGQFFLPHQFYSS